MEECNICANHFCLTDIQQMICCKKYYCKQCVSSLIIIQLNCTIKLDNITFHCPTDGCDHILTIQHIHSMALPNWPEIDSIMLRKYFSLTNDIVSCPMQNCNYAFISDQKCAYTCQKCGYQWGENRSIARTVTKEFGGIATYLEETLLCEQCPNCSACISKNGGCPHMVCNLCKFEFCWQCLQEYKNYRHNQNAICGGRMASLLFFYFLFGYFLFPNLIIFDTVKYFFKQIWKLILNISISAFYICSHSVWLCWFSSSYNRHNSCFCFGFISALIYEAIVQYIWFRFHLFSRMLSIIVQVALFVEILLFQQLLYSISGRRIISIQRCFDFMVASLTIVVICIMDERYCKPIIGLMIPVLMLAYLIDCNIRHNCCVCMVKIMLVGAVIMYNMHAREWRISLISIEWAYSLVRLDFK